ncbi:MAG: SPFH domain-containing protein, partial [Lachnospiraceae bacterium]|nr:SPFH domain-containing protein [Lachnospiraceae bacterium]
MTKKLRNLIIGVAVIIGAIVIFHMVTYKTMENEYTVVKQFGKISSVNSEAGLRLKIPFIQHVNSIPKSVQFYDLPKSDVITSDKKTMIVDAYVLWQVTDAKKFTSSLNANTSTAEGRIDVIVYNAIKTTISNMSQEELIMSRDEVIDTSNAETKLEDVEIKDISEEESTGESAEKAEVIAISSKLLECVGNQCDQYGIEVRDIEIKVLDLPNEN